VNHDKRVRNLKNPLARGRGSESGAHVRQVIRERERTDRLWGNNAAKGKRDTRSPGSGHASRA
jgi:hypothetical protein